MEEVTIAISDPC